MEDGGLLPWGPGVLPVPLLRLVVSSLEPLPDDELVAEREMLEYARRCLAVMRRRTRSLRATGADP